MRISDWSSDVCSSDLCLGAMSTADGPGYSCHRSIMVLDLRCGGRRWMTNSVGFLIVRRICLRSFLRGPMRDGQLPAVPDRHEVKAEAQNPAGQRGTAIGETEPIDDDETVCADKGC